MENWILSDSLTIPYKTQEVKYQLLCSWLASFNWILEQEMKQLKTYHIFSLPKKETPQIHF